MAKDSSTTEQRQPDEQPTEQRQPDEQPSSAPAEQTVAPEPVVQEAVEEQESPRTPAPPRRRQIAPPKL